MRLLIVKTTSMGDVVHAVPVIDDIRKHFPDAEIDWLVEGSFADIPRNVQGVSEVIVCSVRQWKKRLAKRQTWSEIKDLKAKLRAKHYDLVIDLQGLIKSAVLASWTGAVVCGYDRQSIKERIATVLYQRKYAISREKSAVERCRLLAAKSLGYDPGNTRPQFSFKPSGKPALKGAVIFFCNTSRDTKLWPEQKWVQVGRSIVEQGRQIILPWGSEEEHQRVGRIAKAIGAAAFVPERMPIGKLMELLGEAYAVIGLDTGMTHLSSAMGLPTVGIFRDYPVELVPLEGAAKKAALGGVACCPEVKDVLSAYQKVTQ